MTPRSEPFIAERFAAARWLAFALVVSCLCAALVGCDRSQRELDEAVRLLSVGEPQAARVLLERAGLDHSEAGVALAVQAHLQLDEFERALALVEANPTALSAEEHADTCTLAVRDALLSELAELAASRVDRCAQLHAAGRADFDAWQAYAGLASNDGVTEPARMERLRSLSAALPDLAPGPVTDRAAEGIFEAWTFACGALPLDQREACLREAILAIDDPSFREALAALPPREPQVEDDASAAEPTTEPATERAHEVTP